MKDCCLTTHTHTHTHIHTHIHICIHTHTECIQKVLKRREINNKRNVDFLQNTPIGIQHSYFSKFLMGLSTSETFLYIWFEAVQTDSFSYPLIPQIAINPKFRK